MLSIGSATIGADYENVHAIASDIVHNIIPSTVSSIGTSVVNTKYALDSVWAGESAHQFSVKLDRDYEALKQYMEEAGDYLSNEIDKTYGNVSNYDEEIAAQLFGASPSQPTVTVEKGMGSSYVGASEFDTVKAAKTTTKEEAIDSTKYILKHGDAMMDVATVSIFEAGFAVSDMVFDVGMVAAGAIVAGVYYPMDLVLGTDYTNKTFESNLELAKEETYKDMFDKFYDETSVGRRMKNDCMEFDTTREVSVELSKAAILSAAGGAIGSTAVATLKVGDTAVNVVYDISEGKDVNTALTEGAVKAGVTIIGSDLVKNNVTEEAIYDIVYAAGSGMTGLSKDYNTAIKNGATESEATEYAMSNFVVRAGSSYMLGKVVGDNADPLIKSGKSVVLDVGQGAVSEMTKSIYNDQTVSENLNQYVNSNQIVRDASVGAIKVYTNKVAKEFGKEFAEAI